MKQRYTTKDKEYQTYTDFYIRYKMSSRVLNPNDMPNMDSIFFDKENITTELLTRIGDQFGKYFRGNTETTAYIPYLELRLAEIEERFKAYQKQRVNTGYPEPQEMPKELLKEKLNWQARLDVTDVEIENLTKRLKSFKDEDEKKEEDHVLEYGLLGNGHFWGSQAPTLDLINILKEIDGQRITQTSEGLLIINDSRSLYSGMSVANYRALCNTWRDVQKKRSREKLKALQLKAREEGLPMPAHLPARSPVKVSKNSLPAWPEGIKNYLEEPEESSTVIKRTKNK